jgi:hypothetical protein
MTQGPWVIRSTFGDRLLFAKLGEWLSLAAFTALSSRG